MSFNPLQEKGIPIEKQLRSWHEITKKPFNKTDVNCYTRTRQILMNGIEIEAWNFKHAFARLSNDEETLKFLSHCQLSISRQHPATSSIVLVRDL